MSKIIPLVIMKKNREILDCTLINEKGLKKSIENNQLWVIHSETRRLLPYSEKADFISLEENANWAEAIVSEEFIPNQNESGAKVVETVETVNSVEKEDQERFGTILLNLESIIQKRHQEMPEGSYTTHLFNSGAEKIRKKTGEEAVELILASQKSEMIYESADLIYHLMVLLESENLSISEVLQELASRK